MADLSPTNREPAQEGPEDDSDADVPETPAPMFALRAFRTAIFGTPQQTTVPRKTAMKTSNENLAETDPDESALISSPSKPAGILLTPGTGTAKRKSVSFGASVKDNEGRRLSRSGLPSNCPGKFPSPWTPKSLDRNGSQAVTSLTKSLYQARSESAASPTNTQPTDKDQSTSRRRGSDDITVDLNEPRSESGLYWKREFEAYHEQTRLEMKKLMKYRLMAKSYARKKDADATDLAEKLREERTKVVRLEKQLQSSLDLLLPAPVPDPKTCTAGQKALFDVEREVEAITLSEKAKRQGMSPSTKNALVESNQGIRTDSHQAKEVEALRRDCDSLKTVLRNAERKADRLEKEKTSLSSQLARSKEALERERARRVDREKRRDDREEETEKRHLDEVTKLRNEVQALKSNGSPVSHSATHEALKSPFTSQKRVTEHHKWDTKDPDHHMDPFREARTTPRQLRKSPDRIPSTPWDKLEEDIKEIQESRQRRASPDCSPSRPRPWRKLREEVKETEDLKAFTDSQRKAKRFFLDDNNVEDMSLQVPIAESTIGKLDFLDSPVRKQLRPRLPDVDAVLQDLKLNTAYGKPFSRRTTRSPSAAPPFGLGDEDHKYPSPARSPSLALASLSPSLRLPARGPSARLSARKNLFPSATVSPSRSSRISGLPPRPVLYDFTSSPPKMERLDAAQNVGRFATAEDTGVEPGSYIGASGRVIPPERAAKAMARVERSLGERGDVMGLESARKRRQPSTGFGEIF